MRLSRRVARLEIHVTLIQAELTKIVEVLEKVTDNQWLAHVRTLPAYRAATKGESVGKEPTT